MSSDGVSDAVVWYGGQPHDITREIGWAEYAERNSDLDSRADPVQNWDVRWTGSSEQIEVWPIPTGNDMKLQIKGQRDLRPLIADDDVCDLDGTLIVLYAATEILLDQKSGKATLMQGMAQARLRRLKGRSVMSRPPVKMHGGAHMEMPSGKHITIRVR